MSAESFLNGRVVLHCGDSRDVLKTIPDCSIDSIVTDPPYALVSIVKRFGAGNAAAVKVPEGGSGAYARASAGFMGKAWDTGETAFATDFWAECLRVLKPGGHVVAFSGTRTYHRMACAIEDAGFDVRNMLSWNFGSGFPKSHNISKTLDDKKERCSCSPNLRGLRDDLDSSQPLSGSPQQDVRTDLHGGDDWVEKHRAEGDGLDTVRHLRQVDSSGAIEDQEDAEVLLQPFLPEQDVCGTVAAICCERTGKDLSGQGIEGAKERSVEGRRDVSQAPRQLRERPLCALPAGSDLDGPNGRVRDGASACDGAMGEAPTISDRVRAPSGPQTAKQSESELRALAGQPKPQISGAWDHCGRCGKPLVPDGLGTDLKPAHEPICLARKPLAANTIAANVLEHGTGAINIDGCRVDGGGGCKADEGARGFNAGTINALGGHLNSMSSSPVEGLGRWPANIIHDGSDEVLAAFPYTSSGGGPTDGDRNGVIYGEYAKRSLTNHGANEGSAARFFYSSKADGDDRLGSKHPTVKPVDLMQWLCRLVTPPGGTVLDVFAGTGTTGEAAFREGFNAVLIEREEEYQADIRRRMALCMSGPDERKRESVKAKFGDVPFEAGSLFADLNEPTPLEVSEPT